MRKLEKSIQCPRVLEDKGPDAVNNLIEAAEHGTSNLSFSSSIYNGDGVKEQLLEDQNGKCAYCESVKGRDFGAVEHYRPKAGWLKLGESPHQLHKPGYYWLAYHWQNLLYSCSICNTCYKKNLFPLMDEQQRDIANRDVSREVPLIINPYFDNPCEYLVFHENYICERKTNAEVEQRGKTTIKCLGLDSEALNEARREVWEQYGDACLSLKIAQVMNDTDSIQHFTSVIERMKSPAGQYSGMLCNQFNV